MADTYTRWANTSNEGALIGNVYTISGNTIGNPIIKFTFTDESYLDLAAPAQTTDTWYPSSGMIIISPPLLRNEFGGVGHNAYYNSVGVVIPFLFTEFVDGLYFYEFAEASTPNDTEDQYIIFMPKIEAAIAALAQSLLDGQCSCSMDEELTKKFVKAKALQQLIYAKVSDLGTTYNATSFREVNTDIGVLTNFLAGTTDVCGC
tara:strand:+ start:342 stop:953 length:612 start_codon:yes stop_codon:yes gene_type:complete